MPVSWQGDDPTQADGAVDGDAYHEARIDVNDALRQLKHNLTAAQRERDDIRQHASDVEAEAWAKEHEITLLKEATLSLQRQLAAKEASQRSSDENITRLQAELDHARHEVLELRTSSARMGRRDEDDDAGNRPVSVDEQLVEACKAVDTATLVEIVQRFHKMQDDYDEALEQLGISARQLSQSRAECALLSRQLGTASADVEAHKRQFRLQMAKTKRLEDMLDESQVALAESQGELAGLKQVVCMLEEEIAQLDSASSNALIEASLADELTTGGARGNTHDVESLQRQIHSMLATAEVALGISHATSESCVVRLKHLLNDVTARAANESNARCVAKQTISELTEQQRASELEIERMNLMLRTMTSHQRPRRAAQATGSVEPDEYLKTLDTLEAQLAKMVQQPRILEHREQEATLDELVDQFRSGTAHLLSVLNSAAVAAPPATDGGDAEEGGYDGKTVGTNANVNTVAQGFVRHLCALGHGVVHVVGVTTGQMEYNPDAFLSPTECHPTVPVVTTTTVSSATATTPNASTRDIVEMVRSLLRTLGVTCSLRDGSMVDSWCQGAAPVVVARTIAVDRECQFPEESAVEAPSLDRPLTRGVVNDEADIVDFEHQIALALHQDAVSAAHMNQGDDSRGECVQYPGLTAVARLWVRSCIDYGVLHVCTHRQRAAPFDPYGERFRSLDRTRLSDELVREVSLALDSDDRDLVLYLTDRLPPPDFDALSEMIADSNHHRAMGADGTSALQSTDNVTTIDTDAANSAAGTLADDIEFLQGSNHASSSVSKAEGFINLVRAIFRGGAPSVEPSIQIVSGAAVFTEADTEETSANRMAASSPQRRASATRTPLMPSSSSSSSSGYNDAGSGSAGRSDVPVIGIQQRFLELCKEGGESLTYLRVKKVLVEEYGNQLFQRHREFFVSHLETSSRATAAEKENRCVSREASTSGNDDVCVRDANGIPRTDLGPHLTPTVGASMPRESVDAIDPEASATIDHLNHMLISAKATIAKAMWQEEAYRVYVRNRDRILVRLLKNTAPGESLSQETVQLLLGTLCDVNE